MRTAQAQWTTWHSPTPSIALLCQFYVIAVVVVVVVAYINIVLQIIIALVIKFIFILRIITIGMLNLQVLYVQITLVEKPTSDTVLVGANPWHGYCHNIKYIIQ